MKSRANSVAATSSHDSVAETHIGESQTTHVIIMEFPSVAAVQGVFKDSKYIELIPSRTKAFPVLDILIS